MAQQRLAEPGPDHAQSRPRVLVVDDERELAELARALLEASGFDAVAVQSAEQALAALAATPGFAALFSDIMMPGMTGLQLAETVHRMYPAMKIILTSGYTMPALLGRHDTAYAYLPKPYRIQSVVALLGDEPPA